LVVGEIGEQQKNTINKISSNVSGIKDIKDQLKDKKVEAWLVTPEKD
jgi:osmotically-inducible protein OsmY